MAWSYHKRIKVIPGIQLNLSKSGISTSIGWKGASLNFGSRGLSLNTPVGQLRIQSRLRLPDVNVRKGIGSIPASLPLRSHDDNIFSAEIGAITSPGMRGIREAILMAFQQRQDLKRDLGMVKRKLARSRLRLTLSYLLIYGLINRSASGKIKADIKARNDVAVQIALQIDQSVVTLDVRFDPDCAARHRQIVQAFKKLMTSQKIWDVTSAHYQDRVAARSSASTLVMKKEVRFGLASIPDIRTDVEVLHFQNANGADLYFYPDFIIMQESPGNFAVIGVDELILSHGAIRFTETGPVPADSTIIDHTWAKVNKNGSPDKRFKENYQIPVVRYGELRLKTATGVHEEYECSNYEATEAFGLAFAAYQRHIRSIREQAPFG